MRPFQQVLRQILEDRCVQLVSNLLPLTFGGDKTRIPKHSEVPGDGRPAGIEAICDLARSQGPVPKHSKNCAPCFVGERPEGAA